MNRSIALKTFVEHWKSTLAWVLTALALIAIQLSVYPGIVKSGEGIEALLDAFPEAYKEMFRMEDYTSGAGYLGTELFSLVIPFIFIALGAAWGAGYTASEEERGTADILFSLPISRSTVLASKTIAALATMVLLGTVMVSALAIGARVVDLDVSTEGLVAATLASALIGLLFSGLSLIVGVMTGKKGAALGATTGVAVILFLLYSLDPLVDSLDWVTPINPFDWMLDGRPLSNGVQFIGCAKLAATALTLHALAYWRFSRRDIRS